MKFSVYVSAEEIRVIGHSGGKVKKFVTEPLPEGTMFNGTITDGAILAESLAGMKAAHPGLFTNCSLVVDGGSILCRRLVTPKLSVRQCLQLVRDEFAGLIRDDEMVCGFTRFENAILACAVNKAQVDSYILTFKQAGIKLKNIHVGAETLVGFVKSKPELQDSAVVLNVIDGRTMLSMLFENGENIFISRARLFGDENILENLNGLIQFAQSQNLGEIKASYYLGISSEDIEGIAEPDARNDGSVLLSALKPREDVNAPPEAHFACLNMLFGEGGIDLLAARAELERYVRRRPKRRWVPVFAVYALLLAGVAGYYATQAYGIENGIREITEHINSPEVARKFAELTAMTEETALYQDIARKAEYKAKFVGSMPAAVSPMLDFIIFGHGVPVAVSSFDFNERTGIVRVSAAAADASVANDYVDALYAGGVAKNVFYQGYGTSGGLFVFTIDITLRGAE